MNRPSPAQFAQLLDDSRHGDAAALDELLPVVYDELRRLARHYLSRERADHTLQPTALVHETYLRLLGQERVDWRNHAQFFGVAAQMMRRILADHAKTRGREKRGGGAVHLSLDEAVGLADERAAELIALDDALVALDDALVALAAFDQRKCRVVELRYFGGLSVEETAEVLGVSANTVLRDWLVAKAWLYRELNRETSDES